MRARRRPLNRWGWLWIVTGILLLAGANGESVALWLGYESLDQLLGMISGNIQAAYLSVGGLTPSNPVYGYLLVTGLVMLALLPVALLLIKRLADRIFP